MDNWIFWTVSGFMGLVVALTLARASRAAPAQAASQDLEIYRDQLAEVERDLVRGTLDPDEAERLRIEVSRRLLDADRNASRADSPARGSTIAAAAIIATAIAAAYLFYSRLGAPGYDDLPAKARIAALEEARAARPSQAEAEGLSPAPPAPAADADFIELVDQLRDAVSRNPDDLRGQQLLARNEAALGNFRQAAAAQKQVIALQDSPSATEYAHLAELLAISAGGYVSPEGEAALEQALAHDADQPLALYLSGLMMAQGGREDLAFHYWKKALDVSPAAAPWQQSVLQAMPEIAMRAGARWTAPTVMGAISDLPAADRAEATQELVEGLAGRLEAQGGSAAEWARLITAYGVLNRANDARMAWQKAQVVLDGQPDLSVVRQAAIDAGVME